MPKFSVIVPCHNEQSTIRLLLDTLRGQISPCAGNQDYEFNARVLKASGRIWLDPSIRSVYFARFTLLELPWQYRRYEYWKWRMLRCYPYTLHWRQVLPPLFALSLSGLAVLSKFFAFARFLLAGELIIYFFIMIFAGLHSAVRRQKPYLVPGLPLAIPAIHTTWGSGFLWSILESGFKKNG